MGIEEKETIILINEADLKDGYFCFDTSIKRHADRILKLGFTPKKQSEEYWSFHLPKSYLSKAMGIRKPKVVTEKMRLQGKALSIIKS